MSEYVKIETQYTDEALLRQAVETVCKQHIMRPELHEAGDERALVGYLNDAREETAQFIIRRNVLSPGGYSNDVGWTRQPDGTYRLIVSEYDRRNTHSMTVVGDVDVEYQRLVIEKKVLTNPRLRGARVVAQRSKSGAVNIQILNVRV